MLKLPKIRKITIREKHFKTFIHLNFILGIVYAFYHFMRTPKSVDMATRRMWAYETWIIFTLYSIFIYLFSIEVASEDEEPILHKLFKIRKSIEIKENTENAKKYFEKIENEPEKYAFDTHLGIKPLEGNLSEKGSIFETSEKFFLVPVTLKFISLGIQKNSFSFKLIKPLSFLKIKGRFHVKEIEEGTAKIYLTIFSKASGILEHLILAIIFISPIRILIRKQLKRELKFIKSRIEKK